MSEQPVTFASLKEDLRCGPWEQKLESLECQVRELRDKCPFAYKWIRGELTALLGEPCT